MINFLRFVDLSYHLGDTLSAAEVLDQFGHQRRGSNVLSLLQRYSQVPWRKSQDLCGLEVGYVGDEKLPSYVGIIS